MAASASMLRVDMNATLNFADKVMGDPEEAVKMASAFQRLGVSVGNLVDPYSMMNDAMNDPEKLQASIAKAAQQFTFFDEKAKSFRINPRGILTLKEMATETNVSYDNLTKMGLAAAETTKRMTQISPSLKFQNESDKQFLSNLSEMNDSGEYIVHIRDSQGSDNMKKLSDVTQQEFDKLIDEQKKSPKDMVSIARESMKTGDVIKDDVHAIREAVVRGIVSTSFVKDNLESARRMATVPSGALSNSFARTEKYNVPANNLINAIRDAAKDLSGGKPSSDVWKEVSVKFKDQGEQFMIAMQSSIKQVAKEIDSKPLGYNKAELGELAMAAWTGVKNLASYKPEKNESGVSDATTNAAIARSNKISGYGTESLINSSNPNQTLTSAVGETNRTSKDDITFTLKIEAPPGVNEQYLDQIFKTEKFKQLIYTYVQQKNIELQKTKK